MQKHQQVCLQISSLLFPAYRLNGIAIVVFLFFLPLDNVGRTGILRSGWNSGCIGHFAFIAFYFIYPFLAAAKEEPKKEYYGSELMEGKEIYRTDGYCL